MITQEELEEYIRLQDMFDPFNNDGMSMIEICHQNTREDLDKFVELYEKIKTAAEFYFYAYCTTNHNIRGIDTIRTNNNDSCHWSEHTKYYFRSIRRYDKGKDYQYDMDKKYPEGYFSGVIDRYDAEGDYFSFSVNELMIDNPIKYLTDKYTAIMEEHTRNVESALIAAEKNKEETRYKEYLALKQIYEPMTD